mgnify:CR=1 FL=1
MRLEDLENRRLEFYWTNNRKVEKRLRKVKLARGGYISCAWCGYHSGENNWDKTYGSRWTRNGHIIRHPSWKLASRNSRQWMYKDTITTSEHYYHWNGVTSTIIEFKRNQSGRSHL